MDVLKDHGLRDLRARLEPAVHAIEEGARGRAVDAAGAGPWMDGKNDVDRPFHGGSWRSSPFEALGRGATVTTGILRGAG